MVTMMVMMAMLEVGSGLWLVGMGTIHHVGRNIMMEKSGKKSDNNDTGDKKPNQGVRRGRGG